MPSLSANSSKLQASPIRKLAPHARAAEARGTNVIYLNIGQPDMPTPPQMMAELHDLPLATLAYAPSEGLPVAREAWSAFFSSWNIAFAPDEILVTAGASEAITFILAIVAGGGGEVLVFEPCYTNYLSFAVQADVTMVPITLKVEDGYHFHSIDRLRASLTPNTKAILLCNPSNPTGTVYTAEELEAVAQVALENDLFVICDEVYREFVFGGGTVRSFTEFTELAQKIIVVDSVSKRFNACGVRIGAMISKNKEVISTALKFAQARLSPPSLGQILGEAALDTPRKYFDEVYREYIERRDFMVVALNGMEGVICPLPKGAFYTIAQLPVDDADDFSQWLLSDFNFEGQTVMLAPASGFYSEPELGKQQVRIAYVLKKENLEKAMLCLEKALQVYPGRTIT